MKKLLALTLAIIMALGCTFCLFSCSNDAEIAKKIPGVYEMTDISGYIKQGASTVELTKELYDYYTITLNEDGTALIESKGNGVVYDEEGTWKYEGGKLKLTSAPSGISVVEEMEWKDDVITYKTKQSLGGGDSIEMNMTLTKKQ